MSRVHAEIIVLGGRCYLRDLDSTNGTFILHDDAAERFVEGYVEFDTPLQFGDRRTTLRELFDAHASGTSPGPDR